MRPPTQSPAFPIPKSPPSQWTPAAVIPYVKIGMMIELSTIPLYLYAMYSVKPEDGTMGARTRALLRGVVEQEMLHLSLTGNLLSALNGSMDLYDHKIIPQYPGEILVEKIPLNLDRVNKENLQCFLRIEAPDTPRPPPNNDEPGLLPEPSPPVALQRSRINVAPTYKSIGDFYEDLAKGIKALPNGAFAHNAGKQFSGMDFYEGQMVTINDQASALKALNIIIEQGEGNVAVSNSHYTIFVQLYSNREAWTHFNVPPNPKTKDYKGRSPQDFIYKLSLVFDAGYCYLLQTIQRVWKTGRTADEIELRLLLLRNVQVIMTHILTPVANILVQQKLKNPENGTVAAPCFNYFPLDENGVARPPLEPTQLHKALVDAISVARDASPTDDVKESLRHKGDYIDTKVKPK